MAIDNQEIVYLYLLGKLTTSIMMDKRFLKLRPIVQAVSSLQERGESAPFDPLRIAKLVEVKYSGTDYHKAVLADVLKVKSDPEIHRAVTEKLLLDKIVQEATNQGESGKYDPKVFQSLIESRTDVRQLTRPLTSPKKTMIDMLCLSGLPCVDQYIRGFGNELVIVSARPKAGKSNFLINICARQPPGVRVLYISLADYGFDEINYLLHVIDPKLTKRMGDGFRIADLNALSTNINDIEQCIIESKPTLTIVDRAELMVPIRSHDKTQKEQGEIFRELRRLAKRYNTTLITDGQYSSTGDEYSREAVRRKDGPGVPWMSSQYMSEDRTQRQAQMDLWMGLTRVPQENGTSDMWIFIEGRRQGLLPAVARTSTNSLGVYA